MKVSRVPRPAFDNGEFIHREGAEIGARGYSADGTAAELSRPECRSAPLRRSLPLEDALPEPASFLEFQLRRSIQIVKAKKAATTSGRLDVEAK